jgi:hypothetical protein
MKTSATIAILEGLRFMHVFSHFFKMQGDCKPIAMININERVRLKC